MPGETLGRRLKAEMRRQRISSRSLAGALQISRNRLNAILSDRLLPDYFLMVSLRKALGLSREAAMYIFFGEINAVAPTRRKSAPRQLDELAATPDSRPPARQPVIWKRGYE